MARTIRSIILSVLNNFEGGWVSSGELYSSARGIKKYGGLQDRLLWRADELASQGVIESRPRGRMQGIWYRTAQDAPASTDRDSVIAAAKVQGSRIGRQSPYSTRLCR